MITPLIGALASLECSKLLTVLVSMNQNIFLFRPEIDPPHTSTQFELMYYSLFICAWGH